MDKLLEDRLGDFILQAREKYQSRFTFFLDERQQAVAQKFAKRNNFSTCSLFGGYESSERRVFGAFEPYTEPQEALFPIKAVTCHFPEFRTLSHRDFLGSLMGLGIKRECIGDILLAQHYAIIFVMESIHPVVLTELTKVSSLGVKVADGLQMPLPAAHAFEPVRGTVSSMRLDCVVALLTYESREKTALRIRSKQVFVNHQEEQETSCPLKEGDILSLRGVGKFRIDTIGGLTKKGKISLICSKYI